MPLRIVMTSGMAYQVAEAPFDRTALHGIRVVNCFHIHRGIRKKTAAQGFHDDDTYAARPASRIPSSVA